MTPSSPSDYAIEIKDLDFSYEGNSVLKKASLQLKAGDRACLIGPNGCGKTTLLKLMLGLLSPQGGDIKIFGRDTCDAAQLIGYGPQHAQFDFHFPVSVLDVVLMGTLNMSRSRAKAAAARALKQTNLEDFANRSMAQLSGGQRQRVLIARALACEPKILLLDEPTSNLDMGAEQVFYDMLMQLDETMTILIVSHDVGFVSKIASKVICLNGDMAVHPTAELNGQLMQQLYGHEVRLVRHDHDCRDHAEGHCDVNGKREGDK